MTNEEFSNEFDTLINSFSTQELFGQIQDPLKFDEYQKSVFLTKAQEEIVLGLYSGTLNNDSFEDTEQNRRYLSTLIRTEIFTEKNSKSDNGVSNNSYFYKLPEDLWFITYESAKLSSDNQCLEGKEIEIVPVTQDEYHRIKNNPFKGPNTRRALRLDINNSKVEIVSAYNIGQYLVRYMARPNPIILTDLPEELSINNCNEFTECELHSGIHRTILEVAVQEAIKSRVPNNKQ